MAISKNRLNLTSLFLLHPSAMFDGIETEARVIYFFNLNLSFVLSTLLVNVRALQL